LLVQRPLTEYHNHAFVDMNVPYKHSVIRKALLQPTKGSGE